jgi:hypothetical protein
MKILCCVFSVLVALSSCKKYLDEKPDKKLLLPNTVEAVQGLLDNEASMNLNDPGTGEVSADNYYVTDATFNALSSEALRNTYLWLDDITLNEYANHWSRLYDIVTVANICLESLEKIQPAPANGQAWNNAKGSALLFRSKAFLTIIGYWTRAYDKSTAGTDMGIPLRLNSDYNLVSTRASMQASYDQVINDLKTALPLLPVVPRHVMRPSKQAAMALLSRAYLFMNEFDSAAVYATQYLALNSNLLNFNSLSAVATYPFPLYNTEVCMHGIMFTPLILANTRAVMDSNLYRSYDANDLRKTLFFKSNGNGTFAFRGSYNQSANLFTGVTTGEMYLVNAECLARKGQVTGAMAALNTFLATRWKTGSFVAFAASGPLAALKFILAERRKETIFRDLRWMDLKRLNREPDFQTTLYRRINGKDYSLPPGDNRYALPIPASVIAMSGMQQNPR